VGLDVISGIVLNVGVNGSNNNFGELPPASLSGFVYLDSNNNGLFEPGLGETGLAGSTVTLTGTDDRGNAVNLSFTTAAGGAYSFSNLRPSGPTGYQLTQTVEPPNTLDGKVTAGIPGGTASINMISGIILNPGVAGANNNFGELPVIGLANLSGKVFLDENRDGVADPGEGGLGTVTVTLLGSAGNVVGSTTTAADGSYAFSSLPIGSYTLVESSPNGYGTSTPISLLVMLPPGGLSNQNFGLTTSSLSGFVYVDPNNNGIKDPGEPGIGGVAVTLTGTDVNGDPVTKTTMTLADGSYSFSDLPAGTYSIAETDPSGFAPGRDTLGSPTGMIAPRLLSGIVLSAGQVGFIDNDFAELPTTAGGLEQALISPPVNAALVFPNFISKLEFLGPTDYTGEVRFVNGLYQDLLGRAPDVAGLDLWTRMLFMGVSRQQVASDFWQSAEHRGREVDAFYQTFLHRSADAVGRTAWVNALLAGTSELDVARMILDSPEYQAAHSSDAAFVMGLYADVLGRSASNAEVAGWLQALQGGLSRDAAAQAFLTSQEADVRVVNGFYANFLQRAADPAGEQAAVAALQSSRLTLEEVGESFLASDEYYGLKDR
jgi:hypothetical protein